MSEIVLIRQFDHAVGAGYLDEATTALGWCRALYGVSPRLSFLAGDGLRCACIFDAPDVEAVRNVIRAGSRGEPDALWACTIHPGADDDGRGDPSRPRRALVVVERSFDAPVVFEEFFALGQRKLACFETHDVRFARSYFSADRRRMICLFHAPDTEAVRHANRVAGAPFDRAWPAQAVVSAVVGQPPVAIAV